MKKENTSQEQKSTQIPISETESIDLDFLIPEEATLEVDGTDYILRPVSLKDQMWAKNKFGTTTGENLTDLDFDQLAQFVYHQMDSDGKRAFPYTETEDFDDDGKEVTVKTPGWQTLQDQFKGPKGMVKMMKSFLKVVGISQPLIDKTVEDETKKKAAELPSLNQ